MTNNHELNTYLTDFLGSDMESFLSAKPESRAIRINTLRTNQIEMKERLNKLGVDFTELPFNPIGFRINNDPNPLSHTLEFFLGYFYYQGISSQIPALVLNPQPGDKVLDIAAAPGSKSTQMAAMMHNQGELFLNDISTNRLQSLNVNIQRAGIINEIILNMAGERFGKLFPEYFDKILVDAPCTALGTIANSPEVAKWWSYEKLKKLSVSQKQMLVSAYKALKPGGELVYSTCSIAPEENEMLIQWLLENYPVSISEIPIKKIIACNDGLTQYKNYKFDGNLASAIRVYPNKHNIEGFFVIKLQKDDSVIKNEKYNSPGWISTLTYDDTRIKNELDLISKQWGIENDFWKNFRFIYTKHRIWILCGNIIQIPSERLHNAGLLLSEKRLSGWKLTNQSVQFLDNSISRRKVSLSTHELTELFANGFIQISSLEYGYYVLERDSMAIASVYWEDGKLRIRLPHAFRLDL